MAEPVLETSQCLNAHYVRGFKDVIPQCCWLSWDPLQSAQPSQLLCHCPKPSRSDHDLIWR